MLSLGLECIPWVFECFPWVFECFPWVWSEVFPDFSLGLECFPWVFQVCFKKRGVSWILQCIFKFLEVF